MTSNIAEQPTAEALRWSQPYTIENRPLLVEAGDLSLAVTRLRYEWLLNYSWTVKGNAGAFTCRFLEPCAKAEGALDRIAMATPGADLTLSPRVADRPVVVRPYAPLILPANTTITLYVSHPLWVCAGFANRAERELPLQQLSDTWMGAPTGEGELCYGSHTHARLDQAQLLNLPYRAMTHIKIDNRNRQNFTLERLSIPAPYLSLYEGCNQLHTEPITIVMEPDSLRGVVEIGKVRGEKVVTPPRKQSDRGILVSAWENLFAGA